MTKIEITVVNEDLISIHLKKIEITDVSAFEGPTDGKNRDKRNPLNRLIKITEKKGYLESKQ